MPRSTLSLKLKILKYQLSGQSIFKLWAQPSAARRLVNLAIKGNDDALWILGMAVGYPNPEAQRLALQVLNQNKTRICPDVLWKIWSENRSILLEEFLRSTATPARAAGNREIHILSLLLLNQPLPTQYLEDKRVPFLVTVAATNHPVLSPNAKDALCQLKKVSAINALIKEWRSKPFSWLTEMIKRMGYMATEPVESVIATALLNAQPEKVLQLGHESISPLITCLQDPVLASGAEFCLRNLSHPDAIRELCIIWKNTRASDLKSILSDSAYIPVSPADLRLFFALFQNRLELASSIPPAEVPALISYLQDPDQNISSCAQQSLKQIKQASTQQEICRQYILNDHPLLENVIRSTRYLPDDVPDRALTLFLTGQWQDYDILDFDQKILRIRYQTANQILRKRIMRAVQVSGRSDYLSILTGFTDIKSITPEEVDLLISTLVTNQAWDELFDLAEKTPVQTSIKIINLLKNNNYQPNQSNSPLYTKLISTTPVSSDLPLSSRQLPLAVYRATLRVNGRVNDLSFSPDNQYLAIATASRRIVIWDYRHAKNQRIIKGFNHSLGRVAYLADGSIIATERAAKIEPCGIYHITESAQERIGEHQASITDIIPIGLNRIVTMAADDIVSLWDLDSRAVINQLKLNDSPRTGALQLNAKRYAVITNRPQFFDSANGQVEQPGPVFSSRRGVKTSAPQHAAYTPENNLLVGQFNGQIINYQRNEVLVHRSLFFTHMNRITGLQYLRNSNWIISVDAGSDKIAFTSLDQASQQFLTSPVEKITALFTSPDGKFFASGHENKITLWDTRIQHLPEMINTPLSDLQPASLSLVNESLQNNNLPEDLSTALQWIKIYLEHRFAYDIELAEMDHIQPGEFDILIEDIENE